MKHSSLKLVVLASAAVVVAAVFVVHIVAHHNISAYVAQTKPATTSYMMTAASSSAAVALPLAPAATGPLGGYNVLIADRGNNRIIEVNAAKQIIWSYTSPLLARGAGADDAFFANGGKTIIANMEFDQAIQQIDYATKKVVWQYGVPGVTGSAPGFLHTPDDAYLLPNGNVTVADISNCRVLEISPAKQIVRQYGVTGRCGTAPGLLDYPNGDTPLPNGGMLISNIDAHTIIELNSNWQKIATYTVPITYPSDPQLMHNGNILISDYTNPGKLIEISPQTGKVVWQFAFTSGARKLDKPSIAIELPNGNILASDDDNNRVIVINPTTQQIVWQYGVTGKAGSGSGQLNDPDGVDIILPSTLATVSATAPASAPVTATLPLYAIGQAEQQNVSGTAQIHGYVLQQESGYAIVSDESSGPIGPGDLPVYGPGVAALATGTPYLFTGTLSSGPANPVNGNTFRFSLSTSPQPFTPQ